MTSEFKASKTGENRRIKYVECVSLAHACTADGKLPMLTRVLGCSSSGATYRLLHRYWLFTKGTFRYVWPRSGGCHTCNCGWCPLAPAVCPAGVRLRVRSHDLQISVRRIEAHHGPQFFPTPPNVTFVLPLTAIDHPRKKDPKLNLAVIGAHVINTLDAASPKYRKQRHGCSRRRGPPLQMSARWMQLEECHFRSLAGVFFPLDCTS